MLIPKAIEVLTQILNYVKPGDPPEEHQAIQLGIDALQAVQASREGSQIGALFPLPHESIEFQRR